MGTPSMFKAATTWGTPPWTRVSLLSSSWMSRVNVYNWVGMSKILQPHQTAKAVSSKGILVSTDAWMKAFSMPSMVRGVPSS